MDEIPTITIYTRNDLLESIILHLENLDTTQIDNALMIYAEQHGTVVGTVIGVTTRGAVFTPMTDWDRNSNLEPADIHFVPWDMIRALLGIKS